MSAGPRVLLMQLSQRTSAKGNAYLAGWLGKASVVAFAGEPDKHGNPTWDLFVSTPEPRPEAGQEWSQARPERRPQSPDPGPGPSEISDGPKTAAPPSARGDGWRGSRYVRPANGARRAPAADGGAFVEDGVDDLYR